MSSIPLPALSIRAPEQPDLMGQVGNLMRLKQLAGQQQVQQQQIVAGQQENDQRSMQIKSQKALMQGFQEANGDPDKAVALAQKYGAMPSDILKLKQAGIEQQKQAIELVNMKGARAVQEADLMKGAHDAVAAAKPEDRPQVYAQQLQGLQQMGVDISKAPPQYPGDEQFKFMGAGVQGHKQLVEDALKQSELSKNNAEAAAAGGVEMKQMNDWLAKNPGKGPIDYQAFKVNQARESEIQKEIDPRVLAAKERVAAVDARMQQAIKDGSAKDAGRLLANRDVALSEIQARSNPSFAVQAVNEAKRLDPTYNPQRAEAEFAVAKSPTNVGFFGSAKSLTDKGGTLDQLEKIGQQIPQHDLPVLNTLDDWKKAASGSGPIAHYASTALGVADDYAKVMGGGQGSDTSREQALKLIAPNQSPDQRAQAVEGIRGAVGSQQESRIGNNSVLRAMYGDQPTAQPTPAQAAPQNGKFSVTDPTGTVHYFKSQAQADGFKRDAGIK